MKMRRLPIVAIIFLTVFNFTITQIQSSEKLPFFDELQRELQIVRDNISLKAHKIVTISENGSGTCSHIVINGKDYVLTASHVVEKPIEKVRKLKIDGNAMPEIPEHNKDNIIEFSDKFFMEYTTPKNPFPQNIYLKIVGVSHDYDVALLEPLTKEDALMLQKVPVVNLADYSTAKIGDLVFSNSAPSGEIAFSWGYIMDTDAKCDLYLFKSFRVNLYAIPGSSGGPLFNLKNEIIGIVNFIDGFGGAYGPTSDNLERIIPLLTNGHLVPKMMGAMILDIGLLINSDPDSLKLDYTYLKKIIKNSGLDQYNAVVITDIIPNSPAALAGLKPGYVIEKINGKPTKNNIEVMNEIRLGPDNVSLEVLIPNDKQFYKNIFYIKPEKQIVIFK